MWSRNVLVESQAWQGFIILLLRTTQILVLDLSALKGIASWETSIYDSKHRNYGLDLAGDQIADNQREEERYGYLW